jgi:hypothetical protein
MGNPGRVRWLAALGSVVFAAAPATAEAETPDDFFGVVSHGPLLAEDYPRMQSGGVAKLRFLLSWREIQPAPGVFDWSKADEIVGGAADHGIEPVPFVFGSPSWIGEEARAPLGNAAERQAWRAFLTAAVERYGHGGTYWAGRPAARPIIDWQIWNEPSYPLYWKPRPDARDYADLLALSARSVRAADGRARILLGGLAAVQNGPLPWNFLRDLYRVQGIERHFDAVALHPFSPNMLGVEYQLSKMRRAVSRAGDPRTPIEVTEIGWGSDGPSQSPLVKGVEGQARALRKVFRLLSEKRRRYRIGSVQWLSWQDSASSEPGCGFCQHTGLFTLDREAKPSWREFQRFAGP